MKFTFKKVIGQTEFTFTEEAETHPEFIEKAAFFSGLPTTGPNGELDLKLVHRSTKEGHNYYSLVTETGKKEFKLGQSKDGKTLFPKGWEDLYEGNGQVQQASNVGLGQPAVVNPAPAATQGLGQAQITPTQVQAAPTQVAPTQVAPTQVAAAPVQNQAPVAQPAQVSPQTNNDINNILGKYGIGGAQ